MFGGAGDAADTILANRINRAGQTPADLSVDLDAGQEAARLGSNSRAQLPEMLADQSDAMQRLTGSAYRAGGEGAENIRGALQTRQRGPENFFADRPNNLPQGQLERVQEATDRAMGIHTAQSARATEADLVATQKAKADTLYEQARQQSEPFDLQPALDAMAFRKTNYPPAFANRLQEAIDLFAPSQTGTTNAGRFTVDNIERFDNAKRALDDMIEGAQRGGSNNLARELTGFKHSLMQRVHEARDPTLPPDQQMAKNPFYAQARSEFGTDASNQEALQLGRDALRENSEISVEHHRALSASQQKLFRIGLRESINRTMGSKKPGSDVTQLFQTRRVRELLNEAIPTGRGMLSDTPERFGEYMGREGRMVGTNNKVLGNSATQMRSQDDQEFNGDILGNLYNRFRHSPTLLNVVAESVAALGRRFFGLRQDTAAALAQRLMETDPVARRAYLAHLAQNFGPGPVRNFLSGLDEAAGRIGAGTSSLQLETRH